MLQFRARRDPDISYQDRRSYLYNRTGSGNPFTRWICHAVAYANLPLSVADPRDAMEPKSDDVVGQSASVRQEVEPTRGFPWVTLVLGSGCLEPRSASSIEAIEGLPVAVERALADRERFLDDTSPAEIGASFTVSLIKDRLGIEIDPAGDHPASELPVHAAELSLLTCLLSRFFYAAKALNASAPSRWHDDTAELSVRAQAAEEIGWRSSNLLKSSSPLYWAHLMRRTQRNGLSGASWTELRTQ